MATGSHAAGRVQVAKLNFRQQRVGGLAGNTFVEQAICLLLFTHIG